MQLKSTFRKGGAKNFNLFEKLKKVKPKLIINFQIIEQKIWLHFTF
jgi:hypothetical protein